MIWNLPEDNNGDERKKCSQHDTLVSTACKLSDDKIKNIQWRGKERLYNMLLGLPYFILAASLLEVSWFTKIISIVEHLSRNTAPLQECERCIFVVFFIK